MRLNTNKIFITGTDTGVGKTHVSCILLQAFAAAGYRTMGIKPLASGCAKVGNHYYNDDALQLMSHATIKLPYRLINPYAFAPAIAPNIAANKANTHINVDNLLEHFQQNCFSNYDMMIIEGVGGWSVPLNHSQTMADFVKALNCPVIMVVGMRLGCLNHALLTERAILNDQVPLLGWIANAVQTDFEYFEENLKTLQTHLHSKLLGVTSPAEYAVTIPC